MRFILLSIHNFTVVQIFHGLWFLYIPKFEFEYGNQVEMAAPPRALHGRVYWWATRTMLGHKESPTVREMETSQPQDHPALQHLLTARLFTVAHCPRCRSIYGTTESNVLQRCDVISFCCKVYLRCTPFVAWGTNKGCFDVLQRCAEDLRREAHNLDEQIQEISQGLLQAFYKPHIRMLAGQKKTTTAPRS